MTNASDLQTILPILQNLAANDADATVKAEAQRILDSMRPDLRADSLADAIQTVIDAQESPRDRMQALGQIKDTLTRMRVT